MYRFVIKCYGMIEIRVDCAIAFYVWMVIDDWFID